MNSRDLKEVRNIVLQYLKPWRVKVFLFGSQARGCATELSDIDLALLPEETVPVDWLSGLRDRLDDSLILCDVDLVDLTQASAKLKEKIEAEGIPWND